MRSLRFVTAILAAPMLVAPFVRAHAQTSIGIEIGDSITLAPPMLPIYEQPPLPDPGDIWTPGYWAYGGGGYFWVPGTWVQPPAFGLLWTPGYWGWNNGFYVFSAGYWGRQVGYYGGIDYGYGYGGSGYQGGEWRGNAFSYNRAETNFGALRVQNAYDGPRTERRTEAAASFNGPHGIGARPSAAEESYAHEAHQRQTSQQLQHQQAAERSQPQRATVNGGRPEVAATQRPYSAQTAQPAGRAAGPEASRAAPVPARAQDQHAQPRAEPQQAPQRAPQEQQHAQPRAEPQQAPQRAQQEQHAAPRELAQPHEAAPRPAPHEAEHGEEHHG